MIRDNRRHSWRWHSWRNVRRGFTLLESLLLLSVFSVVAVGVSIGLQCAVNTTAQNDHALAVSTELISEAENWRAAAFGVAPWPATLPYNVTDTVTLSVGGANRTYTRTTTITLWDPNNLATNASPQPNFVRVQMTIDGQVLTVYFCNLT